MRLLNTSTLQPEEFFNNPRGIPDYAILSHTWGAEEVTLEDMRNGSAQNELRFQKIRFTCNQASLDGYKYAWVDTCCIDKASGSELPEAIRSMFEWYRKSKVCYAYLEGISAKDIYDSYIPNDCHMLQEEEKDFRKSKLARHRWFQRGWTLPELIAPSRIKFYGKDWEYLGSSLDLLPEIVSITGIDDKVLGCDTTLKMEFLRRTTVAQRMSWGASRSTTRPEDEAYCLLGLFDVRMPILYGEGAAAFIRLQEEIIKSSTDHSIFVWESATIANNRLLLAPSVSCFRNCGTVRPFGKETELEPYSMTNAGLIVRLHLHDNREGTFAILSCRYADDLNRLIGLRLQRTSRSKTYYVGNSLDDPGRFLDRAITVSWTRISTSHEMDTLLLLRQPPTDFSLPLTQLAQDTFKKETATTVLIHKDFGSHRESPPWMRLNFSVKELYPSMYWSKTRPKQVSGGRKDILLLPPQIHIGAIRIWHRATSFFITFGLEKRNWRRETIDSWINIHDSEHDDITIREVVCREEELHCLDGFAISKFGNKATLVPKRFPDDCLEVSISRRYNMGDETFEINGKAKKLTLSPLAVSLPQISSPQGDSNRKHPLLITYDDCRRPARRVRRA